MAWRFFMPKIDHGRLLEALRVAEARTSGEIRVIVARHRTRDPVREAEGYFHRLGMGGSKHRNGVLIFMAPLSRSYAVIGDTAVHQQCGDAFWSELAQSMGGYFAREAFTDGLVHGIERAGELLARTFPRASEDGPPAPPSADEVP